MRRDGLDARAHGRRAAPLGLRHRAACCLLVLASAFPASAGLALEPTAACRLLDREGLRAREGYRDSGQGTFRCASVGYPFPRGAVGGDEIRFSATGRRGQVGQLQLELALRSRGDLRPVLDAFASLADALSVRSLGQPLPAEARRAMALGVAGAWRVGRAEVALEKITGAVPSLRFVIR
jgi:hypothetical protein